MKKKKISVMIVDDSALVRKTMSEILSSDPELEVIATAGDPIIAADKLRKRVPDVITLDIEMPRMDGITFLKKLMSQHPIPVVICSSVATDGSDYAFKAMEYGALEIIVKPKLGTKRFLEDSRVIICDSVKAAALSKVKRIAPKQDAPPKLSADAILTPASTKSSVISTEKVIVVGASTGGTEALNIFLSGLPEDAPGVLVVQHMPETFTGAFARRLDSQCRIHVKEAEDRDPLASGTALIAPGHSHALLKRVGKRYRTEVKAGPLVNRHRPSVNVLFRSAARYAGANAIGVILTGMGDDGAAGMAEMRQMGAITIAQNEATCVVFGMPKEAIRLGGAQHILPLDQIADVAYQLAKG